MTARKPGCPMSRADVVDRYFLEHRAKLVDLAAFLDRVDRAPGDGPDDYRIAAFRRAIAVLQDAEPQRAKRVLDHFSDPTSEPIESAAGLKGAYGAYEGAAGDGDGSSTGA